ncbi:MAG: cell division protein FtsQ/DivIB, partial [Anaerolineae bacterium]
AIVEASGAPHQSIFLLDPVKMAASVSDLPDIASAEVRLILPDRVVIHVREKEGWAALRIGEEIFPLARDGTVLSQRGAGEPQVVLFSDDGPPISAGTRIDPGFLLAAEQFQEGLPWVEEFAYDPDSGLSIHTPEGHTVLLGGPERTTQKLALLEALRVELAVRAGGPFIIDLRYRRPFLSHSAGDGR